VAGGTEPFVGLGRTVCVVRRWGLALAVAVAAAGSVAAPSHSEPASRPLLGIVGEWGDARLARIEPRSLRPLRGPELDLFDPVGAWAFSPDRSRLALATGCQAGLSLGNLQLVDVRRMRQVGCLAVGYVGALAWPTPNRLLAVANSPLGVLLIDPGALRIIDRTPVEGVGVAGTARAGDRLIFLTGRLRGQRRVVPHRLVVADTRGTIRSVDIGASRASGLVADPSGRRAFLVSGGAVVKVDLATLTVANLRRSSRQRGRGTVSRESRAAVWMGRGLIASFGSDVTIDGRRFRDAPVGLRLIDTRTRTARLVDGKVASAVLAGDVLLATGADEIGLVAYDSRGRKRFQLFQGRSLGVVETFGGRAYVQVAGKAGLQTVDLRTGRILAVRRAPLPLLLLKG
jgi:hypothetical protein